MPMNLIQLLLLIILMVKSTGDEYSCYIIHLKFIIIILPSAFGGNLMNCYVLDYLFENCVTYLILFFVFFPVYKETVSHQELKMIQE